MTLWAVIMKVGKEMNEKMSINCQHERSKTTDLIFRPQRMWMIIYVSCSSEESTENRKQNKS